MEEIKRIVTELILEDVARGPSARSIDLVNEIFDAGIEVLTAPKTEPGTYGHAMKLMVLDEVYPVIFDERCVAKMESIR